jgi:hypothetical protein
MNRSDGKELSVRLGAAVFVVGAMAFDYARVALAAPLPGTITDGSAPFTTTFDENRHGTLTTASGSVSNFHPTNEVFGLQYRLFAFVQPGEVFLTTPTDISPNNPLGISDLLHFDNDPNLGGILVYQSLLDENDAVKDPADDPLSNFEVPSPRPGDIVISEVGPEGSNGAVWSVPTPGFTAMTTYQAISDTPEPSTFILGGLGFVGFLLLRWSRRAAA